MIKYLHVVNLILSYKLSWNSDFQLTYDSIVLTLFSFYLQMAHSKVWTEDDAFRVHRLCYKEKLDWEKAIGDDEVYALLRLNYMRNNGPVSMAYMSLCSVAAALCGPEARVTSTSMDSVLNLYVINIGNAFYSNTIKAFNMIRHNVSIA